MADLPSPLVDAGWLVAHLGASDLVPLDVRWSVGRGAERAAFLEGHLPGARFVDLDRQLAGPPGDGGRHPLPELETFQAAMREHGVDDRSRVVVYDGGTGAAARAWWLLSAAGHRSVSVLDGGLAAHLAAGGPLSRDRWTGPPGDFRVSPFTGWVGPEGVERSGERGVVVVDARSRPRFRGEPDPLDPRPGHVPGARSLPWSELYQDGRVRGRDEVRAALAASGVGAAPVVAYCGSGVTACALLLAREAAGLGRGWLYPGSWSQWALDPSRRVETGG